ncbi:MAG: hypothetical protein KDD25_09415, partial [Bdellovibrionales bacterium]|nr:hypothetical protein [Bdellovibrionales bacterium]
NHSLTPFKLRPFSIKDEMESKRIVAFIGTDGVGKSTVIELLAGTLPSSEVIYMGMKEFRFGITQRLLANPNRISQWLFNFIAYPIETICRNQKIQEMKCNWVLVDRVPIYPFSRGGLIRWIYQCAFPKLDTLVWLKGDPKIIFERKKERNVSAIIKDQEKIQKAIAHIPHSNFLEIDTTTINAEHVTSLVSTEIKKNDT